MSYKNLVENRNESVDGETDWMWVASDSGAWEGPKNDWETSHKTKYFEHVKNFDVIVTAGANQGMYVRHYAKMFKTVYAFEPDPVNFHCLVNNAQFDNVVKMQCALGSENKLIGINNHDKNNVGTYTINETNANLYIPMVTLDTLKLHACDIIQLDVEGYEFQILKGAENTIRKFKPVITAECGDTADIRGFFAWLGYQKLGQSAADVIWVHI
jgi:FkbM family methyltransferase